MYFPTYGHTSRQERLGVNAVAEAVASLGLIWRETPNADVGIDGQIEYVTPEGAATGCMVAVQIKSGPSFLKEKGGQWVFYPEEKHRFYWERFPLPVLVVLHDPDQGISYWQDVRRILRTPVENGTGILVPKVNIFQNAEPETLFRDYAISGEPFLAVENVLTRLLETTSPSSSFPISFFELFCNGLTNICRSLYFGVDLPLTVCEAKLARGGDIGVGLGSSEYEFLLQFIKFLVHQHLADVDFSDCLIDWHDREMVPTFIAPLTSRGRALVKLIDALESELEQKKVISRGHMLHAAQEDGVRMEFAPSHYERIALISDIVAVSKDVMPSKMLQRTFD